MGLCGLSHDEAAEAGTSFRARLPGSVPLAADAICHSDPVDVAEDIGRMFHDDDYRT